MTKDSTSMGLHLTGAARNTGRPNHAPPAGDDSGLTSENIDDLAMVRLKRTNLLVVGDEAATGEVLDQLRLSSRDPIVAWRPGQALDLPSPGRATTLVLHDVDRLRRPRKARLRWLDKAPDTSRS